MKWNQCLLMLMACSQTEPATVPAATPAAPTATTEAAPASPPTQSEDDMTARADHKTMSEDSLTSIPTCTDWQSCLAFDGQNVAIVGTYTVTKPLVNRKGGEDIVRIRIIPAGGNRGAYLEPYWSKYATRDASEVSQFEDKTVTAVGTLHLTPPPNPSNPGIESEMGGACLHPVTSIMVSPK